MSFDIIILARELEELTRYVLPLVYEFRKNYPQARLIIALLPSPNNISYKVNFANKIAGISLVLKPEESLKFFLKGQLPLNFPLNKQGAIISFGKDQPLAMNCAWRTNFPIFAYMEEYTIWHRWIQKLFLSSDMLYAKYRLKKIPSYKLEIAGSLSSDSVKPSLLPLEARLQFKLNPKLPIMAVIPYDNINIIPLQLRFLEEIKNYHHDIQFIMPLSPFVSLNNLKNLFKEHMFFEKGIYYIRLANCAVQLIPSEERYNAYQVSDVAITDSSVVSEELTLLGVPMIVMSGISEIQNKNKFKNVMNKLFNKSSNKINFISFPNIKTQKMVVPEYHMFDMKNIVGKSLEFLKYSELRREMTITLRQYANKSGAAENMVKILTQDLKDIYTSAYKQQKNNKKEAKKRQ